MADYEKWYRALKKENRKAYNAAIQYSEGLIINHNFDHKLAAECEASHVMLVCKVLGIIPE